MLILPSPDRRALFAGPALVGRRVVVDSTIKLKANPIFK